VLIKLWFLSTYSSLPSARARYVFEDSDSAIVMQFFFSVLKILTYGSLMLSCMLECISLGFGVRVCATSVLLSDGKSRSM
jgi:hypothetical protein